MSGVYYIDDAINPHRRTFRVPAERFIKPPRFEKGHFHGPNRDMERLNRDLGQALGSDTVVEYSMDPTSSHYSFVSVTLKRTWTDELSAIAFRIILAAAS